MRRWRLLAVLLVLGGFTDRARADEFAGLVVFGDSLSDTGNVFAPSPPYFDGRWSNGPLYVEQLASRLGLSAPLPSSTGGGNYAQSGATTAELETQITDYLSGNVPDESRLIVLYAGANDFFSGQLNPAVPVGHIVGHITTLSAAGATNFLVPNLPPLGQIPATRGTVFETLLDNVTVRFNDLMEIELNALTTELGVSVYTLDVFAFTQQALADPAAFSLTNVTDPALNPDTGDVVPNPDEYLFWDEAHPSAAAHRILGDLAAAAVPEPCSLVLAFAGAIGMIWMGRHRAGSYERDVR